MSVHVAIPEMGESVAEVILLEWLKSDGEYVERDEPICILETDRANVDLPAPAAGILHPLAQVAQALAVGVVIARIDDETSASPEADAMPEEGTAEGAPAAEAPAPATEEEPATAPASSPGTAHLEGLSPAVRRLVEEHNLDLGQIRATGRGGRFIKQDVIAYIKEQERETRDAQATAPPPPPTPAAAADEGEGTPRVPMARIRKPIGQRLVEAQQTTAMLTTFDEVDLGEIADLRRRHKERFREKHGVSLGLMSFFSRACVVALQEFPEVNASLKGDDIAYHDFVNLGIAVSTERGLLVPVLRGAEHMTMATVEREIKRMASAARDNRLSLDELSGGTFTITNGGVFGSLLSTPMPTPPQAAILGMHAIKDRPAAVDGQVVIRPMMYVALSYDPRLIDGQTSVTFLVRLKDLLEEPTRLMLEI